MIAQIDKLHKESGVYCVIHRDSGMCYIGSSVDMGTRKASHRSQAERGSKTYFHRMLREFGFWNFDFEVLEFCEKEKLLEREKFWIAFFNAASIEGMNTAKNPLANYDREVSQVTRQRISEAGKGRKHPPRSEEWMEAHRNFRHKPEDIERMRQIKRAQNYKHSPETLEKMRKARIGRKLSEEHKNKIRLAGLGRKMSAESIEKTRQANLGIKRSDELKKQISESLKGRERDPEAAKKAGDSNRGRKRTPEQIARIREGLLKSWENGTRKPRSKNKPKEL